VLVVDDPTASPATDPSEGAADGAVRGHVLARIVKAYDVRGRDDELTPAVAAALGDAVARELAAPGGELLVGRDMRPSSPALAAAFAEAVRRAGVGVVDLGLVSTDAVTYASGELGLPGAMFTASHNPAGWNGLKLCRAGAVPVAIDSGLAAVRDAAAAGAGPAAAVPGGLRTFDVMPRFAAHVRGFVDVTRLAGLRVAVDAGNGMGGLVWPAVTDGLGITTVPLFLELDGTFPNHPADPLDATNLADLSRAVVAEGCAVGLAFDGDADRMFAVDAAGAPVDSSLVGAVVATRTLAREQGATVLHNVVCSRDVPEAILRAGGTPVRTRVGHSFIKAEMARTGAALGLEHSGHYYFRDNHRADSGIIAALLLLEAVAEAGSLAAAVAPFATRVRSGERNHRVADPAAAIEAVAAAYADRPQDRLDGLSVDLGPSWFNLRPSNTEPLLRLNAEAPDPAALEAVLAEVGAHLAATTSTA
jgi:phosphomannomutase